MAGQTKRARGLENISEVEGYGGVTVNIGLTQSLYKEWAKGGGCMGPIGDPQPMGWGGGGCQAIAGPIGASSEQLNT